MSFPQKLLATILPKRAFEAIQKGTQKWCITCQCGHERDLWEAGGIRYGALGNKYGFKFCNSCSKFRRHI